MAWSGRDAASIALGYVGLVLWMLPVIPQLIHNVRSKSTAGVSSALFLLSSLSACLFSSFAIATALAIPLIIQPHIYVFTCLLLVSQKVLYESNTRATLKSAATLSGLVLLYAIIEVSTLFIIRAVNKTGWPWIGLVVGCISVALSFSCFIPQIFSVVRNRSGEAISDFFLIMEIFGGVAYIASLALRTDRAFDPVAGAMYGSVVLGCLVLGLLKLYFRIEQKLRFKQLDQAGVLDMSHLEQGRFRGDTLQSTTSTLYGRDPVGYAAKKAGHRSSAMTTGSLQFVPEEHQDSFIPVELVA